VQIKQTLIFKKWFDKLDIFIQAVVASSIDKLGKGNFANCKSVGNGVHEQKINFQKGYRLYFTNFNEKLIILLCAGDKFSQEKDIKKALELKKLL
jgi:putative addiction module killer protein